MQDISNEIDAKFPQLNQKVLTDCLFDFAKDISCYQILSFNVYKKYFDFIIHDSKSETKK